ncbi:MAG: GNAT family N-acetyltransferase [Solirubrobacteraceae bacterium]
MIRRAAPTDAEALGALQLSCWHEAYGELAPPGALDAETLKRRVEVWRGLIEREMDILVLELEEGLDGFACFGPARDDDAGAPTGELYALYLRAARQGVGLGRTLHDRALASLAEAGCGAAILWVAETNDPARRFYTEAGWSADGRAGSRPMRWGLDELRYRRDLP